MDDRQMMEPFEEWPEFRACYLSPLDPVPHYPVSLLGRNHIPMGSPKHLLQHLRRAPHYRSIDLRGVKEQTEGYPGQVRVILLAEDSYGARQVSGYICGMFHPKSEQRTGERFLDPDAPLPTEEMLFLSEKTELAIQLWKSVAVVNPKLLTPTRESKEERFLDFYDSYRGPMHLTELEAAGWMIAAPDGPILTDAVMQEIRLACQERKTALFVTMLPHQVDLERMEELRFKYGFIPISVKRSDLNYQCHVFRSLLEVGEYRVAPDLDVRAVVSNLQRYRGDRYEEPDLERLLDSVRQRDLNRVATQEMLMVAPWQGWKKEGWKQLDQMVGLSGLKDTIRRLVAVSRLEQRTGVPGFPKGRNMAFCGSPGTGKSETARLVAKILREEGCGSGRFVEAGREQMIGEYLGKTSPMVAKLFDQARGGVLFLDEVGALLTCADGDRDSFALEAVNALVRHMELDQDTMVIFATYEDEMRRFLAINPGMSSRVAHIVKFPDYTEEELWEILKVHAARMQCEPPEESRDLCLNFFRKLKARKGKNFGNAREVRRLLRTAVEEMALRLKETESPGLRIGDLRSAAKRLLDQEKTGADRPAIGFA